MVNPENILGIDHK